MQLGDKFGKTRARHVWNISYFKFLEYKSMKHFMWRFPSVPSYYVDYGSECSEGDEIWVLPKCNIFF